MSAFGTHRLHMRAPDASCATGGLYTAPTGGQAIDTQFPVNITWNPTCLTPAGDKVDIYLYAPSAPNSRIHVWENVPFSPGKYSTTIKPKWYQATPSLDLQLRIVEASTPAFMASTPPGPIFTAKYNAPTDGSTPANADLTHPEGGITNVGAIGKSSLSGGKIAAAVIMPLLFVIALIGVYYIKIARTKGKEQRKRWSEAVDKRMSTISTDWKSVTPGGAKEAIRRSMAAPDNRISGFAFGNIRPQSTASDLGQAGVGARGMYSQDNETFDYSAPHIRPGFRGSAYANGERVSRVSFANDPRPKSGKWNEKSVYDENPLPPLPMMTQDQNKGPLTLTSDDIRARMEGQEKDGRGSMDEVMPALSMMRTGGEGLSQAGGDDYLLWEAPTSPTPATPAQHHYIQPQPPVPVPTHDHSPVGMMPMQAMPAAVMSPDEMLRVYAARAQQNNTPGPTYPQQAANYNGNGMRTLYSPAGAPGANVMGGVGLRQHRLSQYSEEDAYIGTAN